MGLLDTLDPQIVQLLQGPTDADEKARRMHALTTMGLAMMQSNMRPLQAIGYGGLIGQQAYHNEGAAQQQAATQRMASLSQALGLQNSLEQHQQTAGARDVINGMQNQPQQPPVSMGPPAPDGSMSQQPAPQAPAGPPQGMTRRDLAARYQAYGAALAQKGYAEQAKQYLDQAEKLQPKLKDTKTLTQNGQRVTVNFYDDGTTEVLPNLSPDAEKAHFIDTGNKVGAVDPFTGQPIPGGGLYNKVQTPDSAANNAVAIRGQNMTDARAREAHADAQGDPVQVESIAQLIANGKMPPPSGFAAARPISQAIMARVAQINPEYSAIDYNTAKTTEQDFAKGKNGNTVRSLNVAVNHLGQLGELSTAMNNGNLQLANKLGNAIATQTGATAPTNFNAVKKIVADEVVKAIIGSGGGVTDREEAAKTIDSAASPAQLAGVIQNYQKLMGGQLQGLKRQYEQNTKRKDFDRFLAPDTIKHLQGAASSDIRSQADKILQGN